MPATRPFVVIKEGGVTFIDAVGASPVENLRTEKHHGTREASDPADALHRTEPVPSRRGLWGLWGLCRRIGLG